MLGKKQATQLSKKDCLVDIRNQTVMKIALHEVDIAVWETMPKDFIIGERNLGQAMGLQGKMSVKAEEAIKIAQSELFRLEKRLEAVDELLKKCS